MSKKRIRNLCLQTIGLFVLLQATAIAQSPGIPDGWSSGYVYANGIRIHYVHATPAPEKPAIVMVHGVTDIGLSWATLTWGLEDDYDIYMLDARSHGLTDPLSPSDDGDTLVKDVVAFVEKMGLEKPILMGHSMGAATVMRIGAEYPDLAQAIVMLDPGLPRINAGQGSGASAQRDAPPPPQRQSAPPPPPQRPESEPEPDRLSFSMAGAPEVLVRQNNYSFDDLVATCQRQTPKWDIVDCEYWALSKKQYHGAYSPEAWQAMSGTMRTGNSLAEIPVPVLVLKADASPEGRASNMEAASVIQNGKLVHIDGGGHNLHHDELEQTLDVITEFLSDL